MSNQQKNVMGTVAIAIALFLAASLLIGARCAQKHYENERLFEQYQDERADELLRKSIENMEEAERVIRQSREQDGL